MKVPKVKLNFLKWLNDVRLDLQSRISGLLSRFQRNRQSPRQLAHLELETERKNLLSSRSDFFIREAYKTLRTNVNFALAGDSPSKIVIVTSALQSEGKSFTALNLAISFAMAEKRTIIIDCDLRRPKLARLLEIKSRNGVSDVLLDTNLLDSAIRPSGKHENLDCVISGSIPPNPSELLGSVRMDRILSALRERYDYIVLDCPPINMVTDAMVLAPKSDGVLFVVRAWQSDRGSVSHAVEQLSYANAKILGFVLNGVDMENSAYGYGKYRYHYGYRRRGYYGRGYYGRGYGYGYVHSYESVPPDDEETSKPEDGKKAEL